MKTRIISIAQANNEVKPDANGHYSYWRTKRLELKKTGYILQIDFENGRTAQFWAKTKKELEKRINR